jgi:uncharacterized membrane protein YfcA
MNVAQVGFFLALAAITVAFAIAWVRAARRGPDSNRPTLAFAAVGAGVSFLDTLGIGSFAPTTAIFKLFRMVDDELIPGTLNVGLTASGVAEACIFVKSIVIDPLLLASTVTSAVLGAWLGAGVVSRLPRRTIQVGMGIALLIAAAVFTGVTLGALPGGGTALALAGWKFGVAVAACFVLGALMTLGIGLYAPCMILLALLGMAPIAAFPIMMGACALLQPTAGIRFLATRRMNFSAALSMTLAGLAGVGVAAFIVKELSLEKLRVLVIFVVTYAAYSMLRSALSDAAASRALRASLDSSR